MDTDFKSGGAVSRLLIRNYSVFIWKFRQQEGYVGIEINRY